MLRPASTALPGSEFNAFLFAPMGEDSNGMSVSVLSGLARSDVDPWKEAARLAQLPGKTAIERLASLIETLPGRALARPEARSAATRLIALLPHSPADDAASGEAPRTIGAMMSSRPWWIYVVLMSFVLGSQYFIASRQLPPKVPDAYVNAAGDVASPQSPANLSK
jgi:hypothetical protein